MKYLKEKTLLEKFTAWDKKRVNKKKLMNKKYDKLSLLEKEALESLVDRRYDSNSWFGVFIFLVPKMVIWFAIFGFVSLYFLKIDIISPLVLISLSLLKIWFMLSMVGLFVDFVNIYKRSKYRKELLK